MGSTPLVPKDMNDKRNNEERVGSTEGTTNLVKNFFARNLFWNKFNINILIWWIQVW